METGQSKFRHKVLGFTLMELIVTVTILMILGAMAFVSLGGYSKNARDSVRISTVSSMLRGLGIVLQKNWKYPIPDGPSVIIAYSGATIGYQWYAGSWVVRIIGIHGKTTDPSDGMDYVYSINVAQNQAQFMSFLENRGSYVMDSQYKISIDPVSAAPVDYSARYPFVQGDTLWILISNTGTTKNQPLQDLQTGAIDIASESTTANMTAYLSSSSGSISGTGIASIIVPLYNPSATCGSSNWWGFVSAPMVNLCAVGVSTGAMDSGGSWAWSCNANNGTRINCSATLTTNVACTGLLANASFYGWATSYTMVNVAAGISGTGTYNATPTTNTCQFSCNTNYTWNGTSCVADTRSSVCGGGIPTNATGTTVNTYTQTWNGTTWTPIINWGYATENCGFSCNVGHTWNGSVCQPLNNLWAKIWPYTAPWANHAYYMVACPNCRLDDIAITTVDAMCQSVWLLRAVRTNNTSALSVNGWEEYNATKYESTQWNSMCWVAWDFYSASRMAVWNSSGLYNWWKIWLQGISLWGNTWNSMADYWCTISWSTCSGQTYGAWINGSNTFIPCAANP